MKSFLYLFYILTLALLTNVTRSTADTSCLSRSPVDHIFRARLFGEAIFETNEFRVEESEQRGSSLEDHHLFYLSPAYLPVLISSRSGDDSSGPVLKQFIHRSLSGRSPPCFMV